MHPDYVPSAPAMQAASHLSSDLRRALAGFLSPLLEQLDAKMDARLVGTFLATIAALITFRHRAYGLLLSELGGYLLSPAKAPAGTKRISNLLRSPQWHPTLIETFLWRRAEARRQELAKEGEEALMLWDQSVIEKIESRKSQGLGPVRSSKAARALKVKPGFYRPPTTKPIFVPGFAWICLLLIGGSGPPTVACMRWFSTRAKNKTSARQVQTRLLIHCAHVWARELVHVFDRGYAGSPWLLLLLEWDLRFLVRWPSRYFLRPGQGGKAQHAWKLARGKRSKDIRYLQEAKTGNLRKLGVFFTEVSHPEVAQVRLWLVVCRSGQGRAPWYLLTNEPIETNEQAWKVVFAYARRWQIEMSFRYSKSELALESPRLWQWERRLKLMLMATLAYAFLLSLLVTELEWLKEWLLRHFCHRTGKRSREVSAPLYRLRAALSRLWLAFPEHQELIQSQSSG